MDSATQTAEAAAVGTGKVRGLLTETQQQEAVDLGYRLFSLRVNPSEVSYKLEEGYGYGYNASARMRNPRLRVSWPTEGRYSEARVEIQLGTTATPMGKVQERANEVKRQALARLAECERERDALPLDKYYEQLLGLATEREARIALGAVLERADLETRGLRRTSSALPGLADDIRRNNTEVGRLDVRIADLRAYIATREGKGL